MPGLAGRREVLWYFSSFDGEAKSVAGTAASVEVVPIREAEYEEIINNNDIAMLKAFWSDFEEFNRLGFGYCAKHNGEVVSVCATALVSKRFVMPQVNALPNWRQKGITTQVSRAFLEHAAGVGRVCNWSTQPENTASKRLAQKLGFSGLTCLTCFNVFKPPTVTPIAAEVSQSVVGVYRINSRLTVHVETEGKSVYMHDGNPGGKLELFSRGGNQFCCTAIDVVVSFDIGSSGKATSIIWGQGNYRLRGERIG